MEHTKCRRRQFTPRRLLYVGDKSCDRLKLCEFSETGLWSEALEYAALNYVWGGPNLFQTVKCRLKDMLSNIRLEELPRVWNICAKEATTTTFLPRKTMRDAVMVCRAVNINWLWIDALCIVQDDPTEKLQEIARMGDIYENGALTIVAATARHSDEGFLSTTFDPKHVHLPFQKLSFPCPDGSVGSIYLIKPPPQADDFLIETRGWTMQERVLSTRALFFSAGRNDWHCKTCPDLVVQLAL